MPRPFARLLTSCALIAAVVLAAGCGGKREPDLEQGQAIYTANCARCHGAQGEGGEVDGLAVPSLVGIAQKIPEEEGQIAFVKTGGAGMPQFGQFLSDNDVKDVVAYTRQQFG